MKKLQLTFVVTIPDITNENFQKTLDIAGSFLKAWKVIFYRSHTGNSGRKLTDIPMPSMGVKIIGESGKVHDFNKKYDVTASTAEYEAKPRGRSASAAEAPDFNLDDLV